MNYYEDYLNQMVDSINYLMEVDRAIETLRSIYFGDNEAQKRKYRDILFLADPKSPDPEEWVKRAEDEFATNPVFLPAKNCGVEITILGKCMLVKAYRTIVKEKRKQKVDITVTIEEIIERIRTGQDD